MMHGKAVRAIREAIGMTQAELGEALGVTETSLDLMEDDQATITKRTEMALHYLAARSLLARAALALAGSGQQAVLRQSDYPAAAEVYDEIQRFLHAVSIEDLRTEASIVRGIDVVTLV